ncbi:MAG: trypsin-like serine protease [Planctomycetota bacterium]
MPTRSRWLGTFVLVTTAAIAPAQVEPEVSAPFFVGIDSGLVANTNPAAAAHGVPEVVWSTVVTVPFAAWLRITYSGVLLAGAADPGGDGSFLRLTSLRDQKRQTQHRRHVGEWQDTSAYFNGDSVLVEILACPGTGQNRLLIGDVIAGPILPGHPDTICGNTDDRVLSTDNRAARNQPTGCTSWMINDCNHCFLTAGHCAAGVNVIQFNVPLSTTGGAIQHPGPQDQYAVDPASKQTNGGQGVGNDWCYFGVFANSTTSLTPFQAYGGAAFDLLATPPPASGQSIRVTGYGSTTAPVSPTWYLVQKTHAGPNATFTGTTIQYATDTTGGNSGSPVFLDGGNQAIGIHTHGGCSATGGANSGTGSNHAGLQAALANPLGVCDCPGLSFSYPNGLPTQVAPNGTSLLRVQVSGPVALLAGSVRFHVSAGGPVQTLIPTTVNPTTFDAAVPAAACGATLQFWFSAQDTAAVSYSDPANAPASQYTTVAADGVTTIRQYDFNTAPPGWTVVNTALTTGAWVRGVPVDTRGPAADFDGSGQCWITGNVNQEDVDGGPTRLVTETVNLAGSFDPVVRYALWFADLTVVDDRLIVEASNDGGVNWVLVEDLAPFTGWQQHQFRVRDHFASPANLVVRFIASDNPNNSVCEAALDAFRIDDVACTTASWSAYGTGCAGAGGTPALSLVSLPVLGGTFTLRADNLGGGVPVMILGVNALSVPIALPQFAAGCTLLAEPTVLEVLTPAGTSATWSLPIPATLTLPGVRLHNQVLEIGTPWTLSNGGVGEIH